MSWSITRRLLLQSLAVAGMQHGTEAVSATPAASSAASANRATLAAWIEGVARQHRLPGLAAVVAQHDRPPLIFTFGHASLPFGVPVSDQTMFHLASTSKHVTAACVLRLVEAGRVRLDQPIGAYLDGLPPLWGEPTIHHLLTHTSGLPDYEDRIEYDRTYAPTRFLEVASAQPVDFAPGLAWSYSNTGYVLLGWLLEKLTGRSYAALVQQDLFAKAGLVDSRIDDAELVIPGRAEPYVVTDDGYRHALRMSGPISGWPDGGVLMSARDVGRWHAFLDSEAFLSPDSRRAMAVPVQMASGRTFPYGYGWSVDALSDGRVFHWHAGNVPGFTSYFIRVPAKRLSVMVLTNIESRSSVQRWIGMTLAEWFAPGSTPLSLPIKDDRDRAQTDVARRMLFRGTAKLEPDPFAVELRCLIEGRLGEKAVPNLSKDPDALRSFDLVEETRTGSQRLRRYRLRYDHHVAHVLIGHAPDDRIYMVRIV